MSEVLRCLLEAHTPVAALTSKEEEEPPLWVSGPLVSTAEKVRLVGWSLLEAAVLGGACLKQPRWAEPA